MAGLADLFGESYDPKNDKPRQQHVPVRPKGELKKLDAGYYRDMPVMDKVGNIGRTLGQAVGYSPTLANRMGEEAKTGIGFVPGVGDALGAVEAKESLLAGDIGKGLLQAGLTAVGVVPGVGDVVAKAGREGLETVADTMAAATRPGIKAYHGSPHSFGKFSMDKIGTGEGAQAYGHGLYFAENEDVARGYRERLAPAKFSDDRGRNLDTGGLLYEELAHAARQAAPDQPYFHIDDAAERVSSVLRGGGDLEVLRKQINDSQGAMSDGWKSAINAAIDKAQKFNRMPSGSMYEVDIAADPEHFLDWDKPLSEQPHLLPQMNQAGYSVPRTADLSVLEQRAAESGPDSWYAMQLNAMKPQLAKPGAEFAPKSEEARAALQQAGIPGIKYLDAGSRGAAEGGSRNYVVFDDKLISIVKKYGIPAALGAGLITEEMARQMQDQGIGGT